VPAFPPTRTLGVVGTLVRDTIHRAARETSPVEAWGGIAYALEALAVALPEGWTLRPILKVGEDLRAEAEAYLQGLPQTDLTTGIVWVAQPNNRVTLELEDSGARKERLAGGVPPWESDELYPRLEGLDALYVNFISGFELSLPTAEGLRPRVAGPIWGDLHSLFLGVDPEGLRVPRPLPDAPAWLSAFPMVQMNAEEFELLGLAAEAPGRDLRLMMVTREGEGAEYRLGFGAGMPLLRGLVPIPKGRILHPDPIGCGDVWGATVFARLLGGESLEEAMGTGNRMARRNAMVQGADGLRLHLAEEWALDRGSA
jgi:hypothetical protein